MDAINHLKKMIPTLAKLCTPLRLKHNNLWKCEKEQEEAFGTINEATKQMTELKQF